MLPVKLEVQRQQTSCGGGVGGADVLSCFRGGPGAFPLFRAGGFQSQMERQPSPGGGGFWREHLNLSDALFLLLACFQSEHPHVKPKSFTLTFIPL